ncbi:Pro-zeta-carotene desaturase, prolycopene producing [Planococcus halocryophilus Or1]|uniref:Phytoene/squalene synthase family protein n=1 Tax=Planococcus halocryophilus TaxID=1215089 RepID=A0A1C7DUL9_9BACL|nr:phytoene/squalene synthase family protein [Planococcus halocryophilus]ANU15092.1 phytoene/squalene synthase family protein [Planococcus halocryophilus]EMF45772.1 Pro-zeta-carotene desaturase, prolycopene producing [Planococcus halocryophilus Or1]
MSKVSNLQKESLMMLKETSRTFFIPISFLDPILKKTVGSAYLCMRAIDEIEDHPKLDDQAKIKLLSTIQKMLETGFDEQSYLDLVTPYKEFLPPVTMRLADWIHVCPEEIRGKVMESTAIMAGGMSKWVEKNWVILTKEDLDEYTYYVAGLVGTMLSDIWYWHDGTVTDPDHAIAFGRGLQAVNMLRNYDEDFERGVTFVPEGWTREDMFNYAKNNLAKADLYVKPIKNKRILMFCKVPLALAHSTLKALKSGKEKMSRVEVEGIVEQLKQEERLS